MLPGKHSVSDGQCGRRVGTAPLSVHSATHERGTQLGGEVVAAKAFVAALAAAF